MSITVVAWDDYTDGLVTYDDRLRVASLEVTTMAEECAAGSAEVILDDATGDFYVYAYRPVYFIETAATDDDFMGIIGPFWTEGRKWTRGTERTGSRRIVTVSLRDINSLLSLRVQKGNDAERDAETDVERITWLINTAEVIGGYGDHGYTIEETSFFFTDAPVDMSESDYTGQYSQGVLDDCMQQSGANCYLYPAPIEDEPLRIGIWYGRTERTDFASIHKISNDPADISPEFYTGFAGETPQWDTGYVFPPSLDAELDRDPSRQITGVMVQYDGSYVYDSLGFTPPTLTRRDMVFSGELIKNATQAAERADRYLVDLQYEDDAISCAIIVPDWLVHAAVAGHRIQFKNSFMPGYQEDYVWMRVASCTVRQVYGEDGNATGWYELALDLRAETPPGPAAPVIPDCVSMGPTDTQALLPNNGYVAAAPGNVFYDQVGGVVNPPLEGPDPGFTGVVGFPIFGAGGSPDQLGDCIGNFVQINVVGSGTLTVNCAQGTGARTLDMTLYHIADDNVTWIADDARPAQDPDTPQEFDVDTHDGDKCFHWVLIQDDTGACGGKWNFVGADWVSTE